MNQDDGELETDDVSLASLRFSLSQLSVWPSMLQEVSVVES